MSKLKALIKRNIKIFFSNKSNIFFSTLALIILVILHFAVFKSQHANVLLDLGVDIEEKWAYWFSDSLMLSSIIPIAGITISLTSLSQIVSDKEKNIINDLYISPLNKSTLLFSYILSSIIISLCLILIYILFLIGYFYFVYELLFNVVQLLSILGLTILSILLGNFFVLIIVSFIKREQAMGALGTILGTLMGFLCGSYIPVGILGDSISKIFTLLPFLPITALTRQTFFSNINSTNIPSEVLNGELANIYGYKLLLNGNELTTFTLIIIVIIYIILFLLLKIIIFKRMRNTD